MWINQGYPLKMQNRGIYLEAIRLLGFIKAHKNFLQDVKSVYKKDPFLKEYPREAAEQAFQLHVYFIYLAKHLSTEVPPIRDLDAMFVEVFGRPGKEIIDGIYSGIEKTPGPSRVESSANMLSK